MYVIVQYKESLNTFIRLKGPGQQTPMDTLLTIRISLSLMSLLLISPVVIFLYPSDETILNWNLLFHVFLDSYIIHNKKSYTYFMFATY